MKTVALLMLFPALAAAQTATLGPSLTMMGASERSGCASQYIGSFGLHYTHRLAPRVFTLHVVARGYWLPSPFTCNEALLLRPPPADGTYDVEYHTNLQSRQYGTADVRLGISPAPGARLSVGGGFALRGGHDVPYAIVELGLPAIDGKLHRFGFQIEYSWLHYTDARARETWLGGQRVNAQPLSPGHWWGHALTLGVRWGLPL
jgi:hypothetical protein